MAIIKCPYCKEKIQDSAVVCKHCHRTLDEKAAKKVDTQLSKTKKKSQKGLGCLVIVITIIVIGVMVNTFSKKIPSTNTTMRTPANTSAPTNTQTADAKKELEELMDLSNKSGLVTSYAFSDTKTVVYVGSTWYTQTVQFKKDFLAKVALLKEKITGYKHFEARDAYSNERVGEVTSSTGSLEVYK